MEGRDRPPDQGRAEGDDQVKKDVHTEHCCFMHGCAYMGGSDCTVASGEKQQARMCGICQFELYDDGGWELAHLINDMITKERDQAVAYLAQIWMNSDSGSNAEHLTQRALIEMLGPDWHRICKKRSHF